MQTYPIKSVAPSIVPFGSRAGLPCYIVELQEGCEPITAGQLLERLTIEGLDEVLLVGDDPAQLIDYDFLCVLRNHNYTLNLITNGEHRLSFGLGMVDHVIVKPKTTELSIELAHDLVLESTTDFKKEDFDSFRYTNGFIEVGAMMTIDFKGIDKLKALFPKWKFCVDMNWRVEQ